MTDLRLVSATDFTPASPVIFTLPGKLGDNLARLPIARRYARRRDIKVDVCVDVGTKDALVPLLRHLPWVNAAYAATGITSDGCGGQPWDFGNPGWFESKYDEVYHLGYRAFPRWGCLTDNAIPPNWPKDLSKDYILSERPLGITWDRDVWETVGRRIWLSAHSSRVEADMATVDTFNEAKPELLKRSHKIVDRFPDMRHQPLYAMAGLFAHSLVVTTYSAMCQLATVVGAPCVVLIPQMPYGLGHYDSRIPWYPGWETAFEGRPDTLVDAVDRAIAAATGVRNEEHAGTPA